MKFLHLADLHLGKRLNEFSLLEDQDYILRQILGIVGEYRPDAVLIAGDVYDRPIPSPEAVALFDRFLTELRKSGPAVIVISGNHDNAKRLAFGEGLMEHAGVHLSPVYDGALKRVTLTDEFGPVCFYLLPYLRAAHVKAVFPEETIDDYSDAIRVVLEHTEYEEGVRKVLVAHQSVIPTDEEIGGVKEVDAGLFDAFDYVALGHIHKSGRIGRDTVRYCGTPLKYAFKNLEQESTVTLVTLGEPGTEPVLDILPLEPLRRLRIIRGSFAEVMDPAFCADERKADYLRIVLTDEEDVREGMRRLRTLYPNVMELEYDNTRTRTQAELVQSPAVSVERAKIDLFGEFYEKQNGAALSDEQRAYIEEMIEKIWGDEK